MAITFKVFLDERRGRADNLYPLKIRVTIDRKHREINLQVKLLKSQWNPVQMQVKRNHPNYKLIQLKINQKLAELQEKAMLLEHKGKILSLDSLSNSLNISQVSVTFISFAKEQVELMLRTGRAGNSIAYGCAVSKLEKFLGSKDVRFEEVNFKLLQEFHAYMISQGLKTNAIACYMREIRAIYNKAIKMDLVDIKHYPFSKYKIKTETTINRTLSTEEMRVVVCFSPKENTNEAIYHSVFLLSFYLIGINFADLLTLEAHNIVSDRVIFKRKKTGKIYSIRLHNKAAEKLTFLKAIYENKGSYLLPFVNSNDTLIKQKNDIALLIHATNEYLKKIASMLNINKPISTYYARYSWANIAKYLGYSKDLIAEALGHEYGNTVTGIYLDNYDKDIIDEMNDRVISAVSQ